MKPANPDALRKIADGMTAAIEDKRRPMTQNPTPKRMREYRSRVHDGDNMERTQRALYALADAHAAGTIPAILAELKTKAAIAPLVYKGTEGGGYYDFIPSQNYRDKSPVGLALQALLDAYKPVSSEAREAQDRQHKIAQLEADVQFGKIPGFFHTPEPLAQRLVEMAGIEAGFRILEPSAGNGHIATAIQSAIDALPIGDWATSLDVIEFNSKLSQILELKGFKVVAQDFTTYTTDKPYDRIIMNPPFEKGQDIEHVRRAYDLLAPGGRVVAIMGAGAFFRSDRKATAFRQWLDIIGGVHEELPAGSFQGKDAMVQTGTNTRVVVIDKPLDTRIIEQHTRECVRNGAAA